MYEHEGELHGEIKINTNGIHDQKSWKEGFLLMRRCKVNEYECIARFPGTGRKQSFKINKKSVDSFTCKGNRLRIQFDNGTTIHCKCDQQCSNHPYGKVLQRIKEGQSVPKEADCQVRFLQDSAILKTPPRERNSLSSDSPSPPFTSVKENWQKSRDGDFKENHIKSCKSERYLTAGASKADQLLSEKCTKSFYSNSPLNQRNGILRTPLKQSLSARKPGMLGSPKKKRLVENGNYTWSRHSTPIQTQKTALQGFSNIGNTCYMNAILQSLCALMTFAADLSSASKQIMKESITPSKSSLYFTLNELIQARKNQLVLSSINKTRLLQEVKKAICSTAKRFSGFDQHDAHEFLVLVLDQLKDEIEKEGCKLFRLPNKLDKNEDPNVIKKRKKHFLNPTVMNFEFEVLHTIKCGSCHNELKNVEICDALSLDLPKHKDAPGSIQDALDIYFSNEEIEYTCEKCGCKESTVTNKCLRLPRIMVLHLKRYNFRSVNKKVDQRVKIPSFLTLRKQCTEETSPCYPFPMSLPAEIPSDSQPRRKILPHSESKVHKFRKIHRASLTRNCFMPPKQNPVVREIECNAAQENIHKFDNHRVLASERHESIDDEMSSAMQRQQLCSSPKSQRNTRERSFSFGEIPEIEVMSEQDQIMKAIEASRQSKLEYDKAHNQSSIEVGRDDFDDEMPDEMLLLADEKAVASPDKSSALWLEDIEDVHFSRIKSPRLATAEKDLTYESSSKWSRGYDTESKLNKRIETPMCINGTYDSPAGEGNGKYQDIPQFDGVGDPLTELKTNEHLGSCLQFQARDNMRTYGAKKLSDIKKDKFEEVLQEEDRVVTNKNQSRKRPSSTLHEGVLNKSFCDLKDDDVSDDQTPIKERSVFFSLSSADEKSDMEIDSPFTKDQIVTPPGKLDFSLSEDKENKLPKIEFGNEDWEAETTSEKDKEEEELQRALALSLQDEDDLMKEAIELSLREFNKINSVPESEDGSESICDIMTPDIERSEEEEEELRKNAETGELPYSYRLVSIVSHLGSSSSTGHYISDVYDTKKKQWYSYNDNEVAEKSELSVKEGRQRNGYIFFYISKDLLEELEDDIFQGMGTNVDSFPPRCASR